MTTEHLRFLKKFRRRRRMVVFLRILILFLFLLQWEICADTGVVDSFIFSSPSRIITCFLKMTDQKLLRKTLLPRFRPIRHFYRYSFFVLLIQHGAIRSVMTLFFL